MHIKTYNALSFKSIPKTIKDAIPVGIGLFIALIGLQNAGLIVKVASMFLCDDLEKLKDHIRKDGNIPADAMIGALSELMESAQEPKN